MSDHRKRHFFLRLYFSISAILKKCAYIFDELGSPLSLGFAVNLEASLRLFELSPLAGLHVRFREEQRRRHPAGHHSDAGQYERPTEPVVGMFRHPLVLVAKHGKHDYADGSADAGAHVQVADGLQKNKIKLI